MKRNYIFILLMTMAFMPGQAQNNINFDASSMEGTTNPAGWIGYMNVSSKPVDGGGYQFGSGWGVGDLVAVFDTGANTVTLKPNRIGDTDIYWQTPGALEGNKIMDATSYIEDDILAGTAFSFNEEVLSNSLNSSGLSVPFTYTAFIKVYAVDYSSFTAYTDPLAVGNFTISLDASQSSVGQHIQYGFQVIGTNISSDVSFDGGYNALGSIVIGPNSTLSINQSIDSQFNVYPNPTANNWKVKSNQSIESIQLFDVLGKQIRS